MKCHVYEMSSWQTGKLRRGHCAIAATGGSQWKCGDCGGAAFQCRAGGAPVAPVLPIVEGEVELRRRSRRED
uniref:Uncharacterized protein n=1 Tax=Globodera rostochiensis TaxID=31243 RepID=A0A914I4F7_GLORO